MKLFDEIQNIQGLSLLQNQDLTSYTTMRLASKGDVVEIYEVVALQQFGADCRL